MSSNTTEVDNIHGNELSVTDIKVEPDNNEHVATANTNDLLLMNYQESDVKLEETAFGNTYQNNNKQTIVFPCEVCGETFYDRFIMEKHLILIHNFSTNISCIKCKQGFVRNSNFYHHNCMNIPNDVASNNIKTSSIQKEGSKRKRKTLPNIDKELPTDQPILINYHQGNSAFKTINKNMNHRNNINQENKHRKSSGALIYEFNKNVEIIGNNAQVESGISKIATSLYTPVDNNSNIYENNKLKRTRNTRSNSKSNGNNSRSNSKFTVTNSGINSKTPADKRECNISTVKKNNMEVETHVSTKCVLYYQINGNVLDKEVLIHEPNCQMKYKVLHEKLRKKEETKILYCQCIIPERSQNGSYPTDLSNCVEYKCPICGDFQSPDESLLHTHFKTIHEIISFKTVKSKIEIKVFITKTSYKNCVEFVKSIKVQRSNHVKLTKEQIVYTIGPRPPDMPSLAKIPKLKIKAVKNRTRKLPSESFELNTALGDVLRTTSDIANISDVTTDETGTFPNDVNRSLKMKDVFTNARVIATQARVSPIATEVHVSPIPTESHVNPIATDAGVSAIATEARVSPIATDGHVAEAHSISTKTNPQNQIPLRNTPTWLPMATAPNIQWVPVATPNTQPWSPMPHPLPYFMYPPHHFGLGHPQQPTIAEVPREVEQNLVAQAIMVAEPPNVGQTVADPPIIQIELDEQIPITIEKTRNQTLSIPPSAFKPTESTAFTAHQAFKPQMAIPDNIRHQNSQFRPRMAIPDNIRHQNSQFPPQFAIPDNIRHQNSQFPPQFAIPDNIRHPNSQFAPQFRIPIYNGPMIRPGYYLPPSFVMPYAPMYYPIQNPSSNDHTHKENIAPHKRKYAKYPSKKIDMVNYTWPRTKKKVEHTCTDCTIIYTLLKKYTIKVKIVHNYPNNNKKAVTEFYQFCDTQLDVFDERSAIEATGISPILINTVKRFLCPVCLDSFYNGNTLVLHVAKAHNIQFIKCINTYLTIAVYLANTGYKNCYRFKEALFLKQDQFTNILDVDKDNPNDLNKLAITQMLRTNICQSCTVMYSMMKNYVLIKVRHVSFDMAKITELKVRIGTKIKTRASKNLSNTQTDGELDLNEKVIRVFTCPLCNDEFSCSEALFSHTLLNHKDYVLFYNKEDMTITFIVNETKFRECSLLITDIKKMVASRKSKLNTDKASACLKLANDVL